MIDEWPLEAEQNFCLGTILELNQLLGTPELHVMQFTGLYDRQGEEIYEGDILLSYEENFINEQEIFEVVYDNGAFCLADFPADEIRIFYRNWYSQVKKKADGSLVGCPLQIIGHMYDPMELLERKAAELVHIQIQEDAAEAWQPELPELVPDLESDY